MTKYFFTFIDKFKVYLAIAAFVLLGGLIAGGPISVYYQWQLSNAAKTIERVTKGKDRQINSVTAQAARLTEIIEKRLPLIVAQQDQNTDQLGQLATVVDDVATKTQRAASTASKAANQAGQAVRKAQAPVSTLRQVPNRPRPAKCWNNKDVFGDPCS